MKYEKTLVIFKPCVIKRNIAGDIMQRIEKKGLDILALKMYKPSKSQYATLYQEHKGKDFYASLLAYMMSGTVIMLVVGGLEAVHICRILSGATDPCNASPGTIRGDFALSMPENVIHTSDSSKNATREISIFFNASEIRKAN